jgi:hypothetical protein
MPTTSECELADPAQVRVFTHRAGRGCRAANPFARGGQRRKAADDAKPNYRPNQTSAAPHDYFTRRRSIRRPNACPKIRQLYRNHLTVGLISKWK